MVLATYDGFYLHIWKYELFNQKESIFEHKTHTIRAILFPLIVWFLFLDTSTIGFWVGITLVLLDLVVLGIDAHVEGDSRKFMGGLPQWEYIIHLFANGFHFAAILLVIGVKINMLITGMLLGRNLLETAGGKLMIFVAENTIPGAIVLGIIHLVVLMPKGKWLWNKYRMKITCC
ncbi:hypothetical protein [Aureibaculum sp. 2210JD6-5]|uniref:hypothetical protein n=1 Tax=Aureibaculum sp. 2210JD6-5 TaxID=3103957 RepID=UPI002ABD90AE|nr:hypothetical protein [Aureibaculum sp. 2210JD6-5]